eukprot:TRINITY_DN13208_c0_g1_i1.p1 TRINITY_DN13208_c0_g1~~TRINITY_DN13208_c0_g1_i1.p1  ORF type:complete len:393 (+),score=59.00 TRINITY_DN13208_c0_g1_i1:63-1181(+)
MPEARVVCVKEYAPAVKLGGPGVQILAAWYGVPGSIRRDVCVSVRQQLAKELRNDGHVWLAASTFRFGDPARFCRKRLLVIFIGENSFATDTTTWGVLHRLTLKFSLKGSFKLLADQALVMAGKIIGAAAPAAGAAAAAGSATATGVATATTAGGAAAAATGAAAAGGIATATGATATGVATATTAGGAAAPAAGAAAAGGIATWTSATLTTIATAAPLVSLGLPSYAGYSAWHGSHGRDFSVVTHLPAHPPPTWALQLREDLRGAVCDFFEHAPDCPICLESLHWGNDLIFLPCRHCFHVTCLQPWELQSRGCPTCRAIPQPQNVLDLTLMDSDEVDDLLTHGIGHAILEGLERAEQLLEAAEFVNSAGLA